MAGPIISKLLTDFFNEIGEKRTLSRQCAIQFLSEPVIPVNLRCG